jgi:hypothetical protein
MRWRHDFLIEHVEGKMLPDPPTYCAVRTERYLFVIYATGERELYDFGRDPFELANAAHDPALRGVKMALATELGRLCRPPPPGFTMP